MKEDAPKVHKSPHLLNSVDDSFEKRKGKWLLFNHFACFAITHFQDVHAFLHSMHPISIDMDLWGVPQLKMRNWFGCSCPLSMRVASNIFIVD